VGVGACLDERWGSATIHCWRGLEWHATGARHESARSSFGADAQRCTASVHAALDRPWPERHRSTALPRLCHRLLNGSGPLSLGPFICRVSCPHHGHTRAGPHICTLLAPVATRYTLSMAISPPSPMLPHVLERLGLTSYLDTLVENGFHNWETVLDITEDDLTALSFKLGHRRTLQREIATFRGVPSTLALDESSPFDQPALSTSALETLARQTQTPPPREKRRYRRHPRPDSDAPKKPKTACMTIPHSCDSKRS
jgi:hypothetical protein